MSITVFACAQSSYEISEKFRIALSDPRDEVLHASFSADGSRILLAGRESTQVFSADTGRLVLTFPAAIPATSGSELLWQPSGSKLLVLDKLGSRMKSGKKAAAYLYDTSSGKLIAVLSGKKKGIRGGRWSPDGERLLTFNTAETETELSVWSQSGALVNSIVEHNLKHPQFLADGRTILFDRGFRANERPIVMWDTASGREVRSFDQTFRKRDAWNFARLAAASPDEKLLCGYYGISDGVICWDARNSEAARFVFPDTKETGDHHFCGFSPDGKQFALLRSKQNHIEFVDGETGKPRSFIQGPTVAACTFAEGSPSAWSPDGRFFLTTNGDDMLSFWEVDSGKRTGGFKLVEKYRYPADYRDSDALLFNPARSVLMAASNRLIRLWDLETGRMIAKFEKSEIGERAKQTRLAHWSPKGDLLLTGTRDGNAVAVRTIVRSGT